MIDVHHAAFPPGNKEWAVTARLAAIFLLAGLLVSEGCATKTYGRQSGLADAEKNNMICPEIALEIGKTFDCMNQVNKGSQASGGAAASKKAMSLASA